MNKQGFGFWIHALVSIIFATICMVAIDIFLPQSLLQNTLIIVTVLTYGLLPDIDIRSSKIYGVFISIGLLLALALLFYNQVITFALLLFLFIITISKHRGFVHKWWFGLMASLPLYFLGWYLVPLGFFAFMLHLAID